MNLEVDQLQVVVGKGSASTSILQDISCHVNGGELTVLHGPSGSGKTTLISCIGLLQTPSAGAISYDGDRFDNDDVSAKDQFRLTEVGFIFQESRLVTALSALDNVAFPLLLNGVSKTSALERAQSLLNDLGLQGSEHKRPGQLSGGERQRVAICRALASRPSILLADEPTASLDWERAEEVVEKLMNYCKASGASFLMITHDHRVIDKADRCFELLGGRLIV